MIKYENTTLKIYISEIYQSLYRYRSTVNKIDRKTEKNSFLRQI
jgi:hypothetical protein